jgi:hypothetical protein
MRDLKENSPAFVSPTVYKLTPYVFEQRYYRGVRKYLQISLYESYLRQFLELEVQWCIDWKLWLCSMGWRSCFLGKTCFLKRYGQFCRNSLTNPSAINFWSQKVNGGPFESSYWALWDDVFGFWIKHVCFEVISDFTYLMKAWKPLSVRFVENCRIRLCSKMTMTELRASCPKTTSK